MAQWQLKLDVQSATASKSMMITASVFTSTYARLPPPANDHEALHHKSTHNVTERAAGTRSKQSDAKQK
jgi:hypothetical protein